MYLIFLDTTTKYKIHKNINECLTHKIRHIKGKSEVSLL